MAPPSPVAAADCSYFTLGGYQSIIKRARGLGYGITPFRQFDPARQRSLLLRHDLDHTLEDAVIFAELEAELNVQSTYFVQTSCDFYNIVSKTGRNIIRRIVALGHEIGLHYEASRYIGSEGKANIQSDISLLESLSSQRVISAAQHLPIDDIAINLTDYVKYEAYERRFTEDPMTYISDSLMVWRQATPHELLDQGKSFQFLTHPENWTGTVSDYKQALLRVMEAEVSVTRQRFLALIDYYCALLRTRAERDAAFRSRGRAENGSE
jgi:hypothetical protein